LSKLVQAPLLSSYCIMRPVWPGSVQGPFFPLWLPPPCLQKSRASILPTPSDRRDGFPTSRASQDSLVSSRRTNSRTGQIPHSYLLDGDARLNFQTVPLVQTRRRLMTRRRPKLASELDGGSALPNPGEQDSLGTILHGTPSGELKFRRCGRPEFQPLSK